MIHLHYWPTPNGHKITIFLEEGGIEYKLHPLNITKGEQQSPEYLTINPNGRMPAIVDTDPADKSGNLSIFESGAILWYLGEKFKKFVPESSRGKVDVSQWLFWQVAGLGPMLGQNHHFNHYAPEKIPYAIDRYTRETTRLYTVLNHHLEMHKWIAAGEYTIADMAIYPWIVPYKMQGQDLEKFPHLKRWFETLQARPAVMKAYEIGTSVSSETQMSDEAKKILFGQQRPN